MSTLLDFLRESNVSSIFCGFVTDLLLVDLASIDFPHSVQNFFPNGTFVLQFVHVTKSLESVSIKNISSSIIIDNFILIYGIINLYGTLTHPLGA